jgi:hypothetical protein
MICRPSTQINIDSNRHFGAVNMGLYYHFVCTLAPSKLNIVNAPQSDGEMILFWQAKKQVRRSVARILFMVVSPCIH